MLTMVIPEGYKHGEYFPSYSSLSFPWNYYGVQKLFFQPKFKKNFWKREIEH